jgi:L-methionine (R)-S-oxide reductase
MMPTTANSSLLAELEQLAARSSSLEDLMREVVQRLPQAVPKFNWVGFYMIDGDDPNMLVLGPYVGAPTPHPRIPLNQGICGAAAASGKTIVVDDVNADPRYLACSLETRSEIVAPVFTDGRVMGELDIDSSTPAAFTAEDRELVERCAALVGRFLETSTERQLP